MHTLIHLLPFAFSLLPLALLAAVATLIPQLTPIGIGNSTIVFGTNPGANEFKAAIFTKVAAVQDVHIMPKNQKPVATCENGDGAAIADFYLCDGFEGDFSILYDSALSYPAGNTQVTIVLPVALPLSVAGMTIGNYTLGVVGNFATYTVTLSQPELTQSRKKEAVLKYTMRHSPAVEGNPTA